MAMGIASAAGSFGQFAMLPGTLGLIEWLGWSSALLVLGLLVALIVPFVGLLRDPRCPAMARNSPGRSPARSVFPLRLLAACPGLLRLWFSGGFHWGAPAGLPGRPAPAGDYRHHGAGAGRVVQHRRYLHCRLAGWAHVQASLAHRIVFAACGGDRAVPVGAGDSTQRLPVRYRHGAALAFYRAFDQWHGGHRIRRAQPVDARRYCLPVPPAGRVPGRLAGGVVYDQTGNYELVWQISILLSVLAAALNWPVRERPVARLQVRAA